MEKPSLVLLCCAQFIIFSSVQASPSAKVLTIHEARGNPASINNYNKNKKPPLILASGYDMSVPINPPPSTDLHSTGDDIYLNINNSKVRVNLDHYDEKIFSLAYRVFIMNDKIGFAYKIASVAVKQNPKNIEWRNKLAQAALWSGNAEVALKQWMYFIENNLEAEQYIDKALLLAKQLFNYDAQAFIYQYQLKKSPKNQNLLLRYNEAVQNQGFPLKALSMLKKIAHSDYIPLFLRRFIEITRTIDQPDLQLHYLHRLNSIDKVDIDARIEEAELLVSTGRFDEAYNIEKEVAAKVAPDNSKFWNSYGSISILSGNSQSAIIAFHNLLNASALDKSYILQLVDLERLDGQIAAAYRDAKHGYKRFSDINLIKSIFQFGANLGKWDELKQYLDSLSPKQLALLKSTPNDAMLLPMIYSRTGNPNKANQEWERILRRWSNLTTVQNSYLWYLVDNEDIKQLEYIIKKWCMVFSLKPTLWEAYASALSIVGDTFHALKVVRQHQGQIYNNYSLLLSAANLYTDNDKPFQAYYLQRRAFYLVLNEFFLHPDTNELKQTQSLVDLMIAFAPASMTYNALVTLSAKLFSEPAVDEVITAWALERRNYDLASRIIKTHDIFSMSTKPWMKLTLALEENDRDLMQFLLIDSPKLLPHREKVTAAIRTGNIKLAEEYAYQGLKKHPQDTETYTLFTDTMLPRSNKISTELAQETWGDVPGPLAKLSARYFVTPSISINPFGLAWFPHTANTAVFASTPSYDETVGIRVRQYIEHGWRELSVAERHSQGQNYPAFFQWRREDAIIPRLNTNVTLSYNVRANESTAILLAGMKNEARLGIEYTTSSYNLFDAEISLQQFLGQDNFYLGAGEELGAHWQHKFYLSYPDWNINFYASWLNYKDDGNAIVSPFLQQIIPVGQDPIVSFFMPVNNVRGAITLGFGQQYREEYTHGLKPFAETGAVYSNFFGWGPTVQGGVATSIFGRDHLVLFGEYTVNQQQTIPLQEIQTQGSQQYYIIGMGYDYYF